MNISAVIPCYNGDRFLQEAVESINTQTYLPREIIIVNDGSNDESERVIEQLKASSQVPITSVNQVNHGVSAARNVGIATASSDWIAFLDVDDLWLPTMLESKVKFAEAQGLTSGLICCNYYVDAIDDANKKHNDSRYAQSIHDRVMQSEEFQSILLKENFIGTPENTNAKLDATPGQSSDDWNQQVEMMQGKNNSMREALAKMWGIDEGKNPFVKDAAKKQEEKKVKAEKTMTGKKTTEVKVDPDLEEKVKEVGKDVEELKKETKLKGKNLAAACGAAPPPA